MRNKPSLALENRLWAEGFRIIGVDESARGTWAGSLWVGAVTLRQGHIPLVQEMIADHGLRDSKQMTPRQRANIYRMILESNLPYAVADATVGEVDAIGIEAAFLIALNRAGSSLVASQRAREMSPADIYAKTALLIDGRRYKDLKVADGTLSEPLNFEVVAEDKLDQTSATVALASVVAKVHQEITMRGLDLIYPEYDLAKNNGYPTSQHRAAVKQHGLTAIHRNSWQVKEDQGQPPVQ